MASLAGQRGWPVFMKDQRIRNRQVERAAVNANGVQAFCLSGGNLKSGVMAEQFLAMIDGTGAACRTSGTIMYVISPSGMRAVPLDPKAVTSGEVCPR